MVVTFFGHRNTPNSVVPLLRQILRELVEEQGADDFYVGNQGNFDAMVCRELSALRSEYPHIRCTVVLAYLPTEAGAISVPDGCRTVFPEEVATVPRRFAISHRNRWMIQKADTVVTYVAFSTGGAAQFEHMAETKGKRIIRLFARETQ